MNSRRLLLDIFNEALRAVLPGQLVRDSLAAGDSIVHVMQAIVNGIERYYPKTKALLVVSDGRSTDETRKLTSILKNRPGASSHSRIT